MHAVQQLGRMHAVQQLERFAEIRFVVLSHTKHDRLVFEHKYELRWEWRTAVEMKEERKRFNKNFVYCREIREHFFKCLGDTQILKT